MNFSAALKSFLGHLEGTQKSLHTIKSYRLDLANFEAYLKKARGNADSIQVEDLNAQDFDHYHSHLKGLGQRINTRRRKLMTLRKFLSYLAGRKKISIDFGRTLATPHKIERVPRVVALEALISKIRDLPTEPSLLARNRLLLWCLAETGCLVSEIGKLRPDSLVGPASSPMLEIPSAKSPRRIPVSTALYDELLAFAHQRETSTSGGPLPLFTGFNKFGSLGSAISSRGVELLVRVCAPKLGFEDLTPRMFRHSTVLYWHQQGLSDKEIQRRLGLKSLYAFKTYAPLFKGELGTAPEVIALSQ